MKKYIYKIYNKDDVYLTTWKDVEPPRFSYKINSGFSDLTVGLARKYNDFGEGGDVKIGNKLKVVVSDIESPDGKTIYSGKLSKYHLITNGRTQRVEVTFTGYVTELSKRIVEDDLGATTINYSMQDPSYVIKDVLDKVNTNVTYNNTIDNTGVSVSYDLIQNTAIEAIERMVELAPPNWHWFVDADDYFNFKAYTSANPMKLFIGNQIEQMDITKSGETLYNTYFFLGGDSPQLYKKYSRTSSQTEYGRSDKREQDERVTVTTTADRRASTFLSTNATLQMEVVVTVLDSNINPEKGVDIDSLKPGMSIQIIDPSVEVGASRWGSLIWGIDSWGYPVNKALAQPLRLEKIDYMGNSAILSLGSLMPTVGYEINRNTIQLETFRGKDSPSTPG